MVPEMRSCRYQKTPPPTTTPPYVTSTTHRRHYDSSYGNQEYSEAGTDFQCQYNSGRYYACGEERTYQQQRAMDGLYVMNPAIRADNINNNYGYERGVDGLRCQSSEVSTSSEDNR
ncbi:transcription factor SUM-1 [Caerostris extrusa]|uniref:Transcription factor SUM-1 n=1 Tax=Caerostris extrusa TaxID=172846 RepID=A0AAV4Y8F1_CAEEX|nr:transcription factor SUM-1 [Caerostris extrusa]